MFGIEYEFGFDLPRVILNFKSERALREYTRTWITGEETYLKFTHNGIEYNPNWWVF